MLSFCRISINQTVIVNKNNYELVLEKKTRMTFHTRHAWRHSSICKSHHMHINIYITAHNNHIQTFFVLQTIFLYINDTVIVKGKYTSNIEFTLKNSNYDSYQENPITFRYYMTAAVTEKKKLCAFTNSQIFHVLTQFFWWCLSNRVQMYH